MISDEAYRDLEEAVGPENVSREPALLDGYAWQPFLNEDPELWIPRPVAAVLPASTEEVQAVVRACGKHGLKFKAVTTGWGAHAGPSSDGIVQIDMCRMNRILEIDEKNMYAVVEPYVCGAQLQAEAMKAGLNTHIIGAGPACSPLASATSMSGVGSDCAYMSYSGRNVLGVEWVLPDGELLKLGTPGSGLDWFSGDGPGPSLRGIMRGVVGAIGGLGVFTKCAVKLFNWTGPPQMEAEGLVLDSKVEIPEKMRFYMCFFNKEKHFADAMYEIGEAEIAYHCVRIAMGAYLALFTPHSGMMILATKALKAILVEAIKFPFAVILAGHSDREIEYQEDVLREIILKNGGVAMDMAKIPSFGSIMPLNFLRVTFIPLAFRVGGIFGTCLDGNETLDTQLRWVDVTADMKQEWIDKECIMDDGGNNPFFVPYENNMWAHCEVLYAYSVKNRDSLEALNPIAFASTLNAIELCMTPLAAFVPNVRKVVSPLAGNFNRWQKKISAVFDPGGAADTGFYTDEIDFDYSRISPDKKKRLDRLTARLKWDESGPPE